MLRLLTKIFSVKRTVMPLSELAYNKEILRVHTPLDSETLKTIKGSLAVREVDAGSSAAEEEELKALTNSYYDAERFGIHFVASPRHADMLMVSGPVTRNMADALKRTYDATPTPRIVVAVGNAAIDGGIFKDSYAVVGGVDKVIPVNFSIPGDPPSAKTILTALLQIMQIVTPENTKNTQ